MFYSAEEMEKKAVMETAARMCAAARTSPKTKGMDGLVTGVVDGEDKDRLAACMRELAVKLGYAFFERDAGNVDRSQAVVLFGMNEVRRGLNEGCRYCHFSDCGECAAQDGLCAWDAVDVGIAVGSAVASAMDERVDNRVMFSVGRAAMEMKLLGDATLVLGVPLSVTGKSPYFDRKKST